MHASIDRLLSRLFAASPTYIPIPTLHQTLPVSLNVKLEQLPCSIIRISYLSMTLVKRSLTALPLRTWLCPIVPRVHLLPGYSKEGRTICSHQRTSRILSARQQTPSSMHTTTASFTRMSNLKISLFAVIVMSACPICCSPISVLPN